MKCRIPVPEVGMKEIKRQLAEYDKAHELEIDALVLWVLHTEFGFGKKKLRQFYDAFGESITALINRYELPNDDRIWLCTEKLKEYGVDLEEWKKNTP